MNASEEFLAPGPRDPDPLVDVMKAVIRQHASAHPRSTQVQLGPSQIGHPCARHLIQGMIGGNEAVINPQFDVLPSYVGVAGHAALEKAFLLDNEKLGRERWLTERKVSVREGLSGTCDLYDTDTNTVIDFKLPGTTAMAEYRRNGPSVIYRAQAHTYGRGYTNAGYPVERVGIWFLPRGGLLAHSLLWTEPYNDGLVTETLEKLDNLIVLMDELELERNPDRLKWIPTTPYSCTWCPFFSVTPSRNPYACSGGMEYQPTITAGSGMAVVK